MEFNLSNPIKGAHVGGDVRDVSLLVLSAPPAYCKEHPIKMRQMFSSCMMSLAKDRPEQENKTEQEAELDGDAVIQMLYMAEADMVKFHEIFEKLLCIKGVCKMDNEADLTKEFYKKIGIDDLDKLLGDYLANFMVPSWMPKDTKK